ncbi:hypothetical protein Gotri_022565 [Gossypium trilobum]|uniref:Uncharacterized protein n=1 Tax=Gossypium trilobum TaxID=34281 RepID=A0A7J9DG89_9ROSI|nr:hypothetical protein [Gossypium trilobum]
MFLMLMPLEQFYSCYFVEKAGMCWKIDPPEHGKMR